MLEFPKFDDVGSFPLPEHVDRKAFKEFYWTAYKALVKNVNIFDHRGINSYFIQPLLGSFNYKIKAGVEIVNYPQHMDMYNQFLKPMEDYEIEPNLIDPKSAIIPELAVIDDFAKKRYEESQEPLKIKLCITGPIELYVRKLGFTIYPDMAYNFSKSINSFLKNSIINNKYLTTPLIAIDEPSFGYTDVLNITDDDFIKIFDKSLERINTTNQIHLHTLNKAFVPLQTNNIHVLTCEYASDRTNKIPKKELDQQDKFIRVGISRTNINRIMADKLDAGEISADSLKTVESSLILVDPKERIKKRLTEALDLYGDRLKYIGPDCGFSGWNVPEAAYELLHRTHEVIEEVKKM